MYSGRGGQRGGYHNNNRNNGRNGNFNSNSFMNPQQSLDRANAFANSNLVTVEIQGWTNASPQNLVSFISRKTRLSLQNVNSNATTGILTATVKSMKQAQDLERCTGMRFAGNSLKIRILDNQDGTKNPATSSTIELLRSFLRMRYNPTSKMLDLTNMVNEASLVQAGLFSTTNTSAKFFSALMKLATHDKLDIESVNLSENSLDERCKYLLELALSYPALKNLAFANNNFTRVDFLEKLKGKFSLLRELIITGNPLLNNSDPGTLRRIVAIFPRLIILNGQQVRDEGRVNALFKFPVTKKAMFFESPDLSKVAANFVSAYIRLWDQQRTELLQLYTQDSQFSYQVDTTHMGSVPMNMGSNWSNYLTHSRNLKRVSGARPRMSKLAVGSDTIMKVFQSLPKTKHSLQETPNLYSMETISFPSLNGMQITLHGEFNETGAADHPLSNNNNHSGGKFNKYNQQRGPAFEKRSFDRTFVVVPGPNGNFIVASDMLLVKPYAGNSAWLESKNIAPPAAVTTPAPLNNTNPTIHPAAPTGNIPQEIAAKLNPEQEQLVLKIMQDTKLNLQFSIMLLEQSGWNYQAAGQNFMSSKSQIPPQAYQQ